MNRIVPFFIGSAFGKSQANKNMGYQNPNPYMDPYNQGMYPPMYNPNVNPYYPEMPYYPPYRR